MTYDIKMSELMPESNGCLTLSRKIKVADSMFEADQPTEIAPHDTLLGVRWYDHRDKTAVCRDVNGFTEIIGFKK